MFGMRRREFVSLFGGAAVAWPVTAWAQQPQRMRRLGVLDTLAGDDPEASVRHGAFMQGLQGWGIGRNVRIDTRWAAGDPGRIRNFAVEIVATGPDVIFTSGFSTIRPLLDATSTLPIVFEANLTGSTLFLPELNAKRLELLKEACPQVARVAALSNPNNPVSKPITPAMQAAATALKLEIATQGPLARADEVIE